MTLPARFSLLHSELNDFLFASVGDEQNGMPLNVAKNKNYIPAVMVFACLALAAALLFGVL